MPHSNVTAYFSATGLQFNVVYFSVMDSFWHWHNCSAQQVKANINQYLQIVFMPSLISACKEIYFLSASIQHFQC